MNPLKKDIDSFVASDFELVGYDPHCKIEMKMAIQTPVLSRQLEDRTELSFLFENLFVHQISGVWYHKSHSRFVDRSEIGDIALGDLI